LSTEKNFHLKHCRQCNITAQYKLWLYSSQDVVATGTGPEKYQRGWLAQKLSYVIVIITYGLSSAKWCKAVTTDGMAMLVGLTGLHLENESTQVE